MIKFVLSSLRALCDALALPRALKISDQTPVEDKWLFADEDKICRMDRAPCFEARAASAPSLETLDDMLQSLLIRMGDLKRLASAEPETVNISADPIVSDMLFDAVPDPILFGATEKEPSVPAYKIHKIQSGERFSWRIGQLGG